MPCTALTRFQVLPIANVRAIGARSMPALPIDAGPDRPYSSNVMSDQRTTLMAKMAAARHRLWIAAVVAIVAGAAAAALASAQAPMYAASAQVGFGTTTLPAQASVALTPAMARVTLHRAHVTSVSGARPALAARRSPSTRVPASPSSASPTRAARGRGGSPTRTPRRSSRPAGTRSPRRHAHEGAASPPAGRGRPRPQDGAGVERISMRAQYGTLVRLWQAIDTRTSIAMDGVQVIGPAAAASDRGPARRARRHPRRDRRRTRRDRAPRR